MTARQLERLYDRQRKLLLASTKSFIANLKRLELKNFMPHGDFTLDILARARKKRKVCETLTIRQSQMQNCGKRCVKGKPYCALHAIEWEGPVGTCKEIKKRKPRRKA